eukprot:365753-Chlamydomonas_euryale.AAC.6
MCTHCARVWASASAVAAATCRRIGAARGCAVTGATAAQRTAWPSPAAANATVAAPSLLAVARPTPAGHSPRPWRVACRATNLAGAAASPAAAAAAAASGHGHALRVLCSSSFSSAAAAAAAIAPTHGSSGVPVRVCVVGAGPAGFYTVSQVGSVGTQCV